MKGLEAKTLGLRKVIRHEYKRIVAFMLTVAMVVTNFGTNLTVAFAAGEEESSLFLLNSSELEDAISTALESGDVFDFSSLELKAKQKSLKTSYEKLIGSKAGKVYQLDVDIDSSYATEHTDLQVFYNAGTDDVVFLFINESDMAVTFRANVSGYETARVTVNPNTTNIEDAEGVENAEDYSGTTMVDDEKKPQAEVVKPEGETSESESASDETEAAETEADVTESENASENGEAEETTGAEEAAETETSAAEETEAETEPETEAEAPAEETEAEIELTPEEGSASASISAKKVFRVSTSAEAAGETPAADAEEETEAETETEAEEPEKETEAPAETTAEETIADETQAEETTAADETDGELTDETEAPTEDVTTPDETTGEQPADNGGSENIGFDSDEQFLEDDSIELAGELNGKAYNTVTIWGSANARAYVVKAEDLTGEAAVEGQYSVDYSVDPVGAATIKGAHTVNEGETLYFAVDPQVGYEITEVTANGEPLEEADAADVASASDLEQHEHVYAVEAVTEDLEIVASLEETVGVAHPEFSASYVSSEGVTISLHAEEGILPEGTELSVTEVTDALGDTIKEKMDSEAEGTTVHSVLAYDINLLYNGKKLSNSWSESGYVDVTFTGAPIQEMTEASDKVEIVAVDDTSKTQLSAENAAEAEAGELKLETVSEQNVEDAAVKEVGFKAEHFTIYAVAASSGVMAASIEGYNATMKIGQKQNLRSDKRGYYVSWSSSDESVLTVTGSDETATVTAVGVGRATITHTYYRSGWKHDTATIIVTADPITGVTLTGENEVKLFGQVQLNANLQPTTGSATLTWESSDESILTVDETGMVTGRKLGTATITVWAVDHAGHRFSAAKEIRVIQATTTEDAQFYYLTTPTADPKSNDSSVWGRNIGTGKIVVTNGTWENNKNMLDSVSSRVVKWPNGTTGSSLEITQTGDYARDWNTIYEAYKTEIEQKHGKTIAKSDIESIKLNPYKISRNNGTSPDKHVDCTVEIKVKDVYTANYWLWNAGQTGYEYAEAGSYYKNDQTSPTASKYPAEKTVNGVTYTFLGWYDNRELAGEAVTFPYTITDHNVNFYAKYVAGYYVDYDLNGGTWGSAQTKWFKNVGSTVVVVATKPTKTGYDFAGWTYSEDGSKTYHADDSFVMPEKNVKLTANWTPQQKSYTVNYLLNGTSEKVQDPDTKTGTWGTKVTENAPDISGYTHVATDDATKTHIVGTAPDEINFYYYKNVTLQANSETYTYDGTEKSVSGYIRTDTNDSLTITGVTAGASGTNAGEYTAEFAVDPVGRLIDAQHIVTAALPGKLIIKPIDDLVTVTIVGKKESKMYNGSTQTTTGYTVTNIEGGNGKYTAANVALVTPGSDTATGTDARAIPYPMGLTTESFQNLNNNFSNVQFTVTDGELTITKRNVVLTSAAASKSYDGTPLTNSEVTVTGDGFASGEGADYHVTGSQTVVGSSDNTFAEPAYTLHDNTKAGNYNITTEEGILIVTANDSEVVVTIREHGDTVTYDGTAHTVSGYDVVSISNNLYHENDFTFVGDTAHQTVSGTNAGTYNMALSATDFRNDNANFSRVTFVIQDNTLEIGKKLLKLTSPSANKIYDGKALTATNLTIDGLVAADADKLTYKVTGTQTEVGTSTNTFNFTLDPSVINNYDVQTTMGELKVTPVTNEIVVKITGNKTNEKYDGIAKTAEGYTYVVECAGADASSLYSAADFTFSGNAKVTEKNAGEYPMGLDASQFTNKDNNTFQKVSFVLVSDGELTITKRNVTLTSADDEKVYDGTALTNSIVTVSGDGFVTNEAPSYDVIGTITNVGEVDNEFTYAFAKGVNADNYNITPVFGKLKVTPVTETVTVTIKENSGTVKYDGTEKTVTGYTVESITNPLYTVNDFTFSGSAEVKGTNAGTYNMNLSPSDFTNTNTSNFPNVTFVVEDGQLVIQKRSVTLTSGSDSKAYDGTALKKETVEVTGDGFAKNEGADYSDFASLTEVGETDNTFTYTLKSNTSKDNYEISVVEGKLTIAATADEVVVTIKENSGTETYDGTEKTVTGYAVQSISSKLYTEKDFTFNGKAEVKGTNAGIYDMELTPADFRNTNQNFTKVTFVIVDGKLTIEKRKVTLTSASASKDYDGTPLTAKNVTVSGDGFANGEGATYDVYGSQTESGSSKNHFRYSLTQGTNTDNYKFTEDLGDLTVRAIETPVVVTIRGKHAEATYDATEKSVTGYTATADNTNYPLNDSSIKFIGDATIKGTDADTYKGTLDAAQFENINKNFKDVTFKVVDPGELVIKPVEITLTSADAEKVYDGTELTNNKVTVTVGAFVGSDGATYNVTGSQLNKGTSKNTFTYQLNEGTKSTNYAITKVYGNLTVNPVTDIVTVTITGHSRTEKYDGEEYTVSGYEIAADNSLYKTSNVQFNGAKDSATGKDAGSYTTELNAADFVNTNENFASVTFVIQNDIVLTVQKRAVTLTSANDSKVYDGTPLTNSEITVGGDGFANGEGATYEVTGTQTTAGTSDNTFNYILNAGTNADNYEISKHEGKLIVTATKDEVVVTITEQSGSFLYNGTEHTVAGYTVTNISNPLYHEADFTFTGNAEVKATDAGTYNMELKEADFHNRNASFEKVKFVIVDGNLTIEKRKVTLASANASKVYDGEALTAQTVTVTAGDGFAEGEGATYKVTGSQTKVGTSENTFTYNLNGNTKPENYDIELVYGKLEVTPVTEKITVTIKGHTETVKYDGDEHSVTGYDVTIPAGSLYTEKDITFSGKAEAKGTDADTYNMGLKAENFANSNGNFANVEFVVKEDGKLTITKRDVTLTSADAEKVYDGTALTNDTVTVSGDGFVKNDGATYDVTGTITNVGTKPNTFTYTLNEGTKADNYNITLKEGNLEINPITDEVVVTIAEHSNSAKYNGKEHKAEGYDVTRISNDLYHESDFSFTGDASHKTVAATNAGSYDMGLLAGDFTNNNGNFTNVRFSIEDGKLEIAKRDVTLTSGTGSKTYDGTALTNDTVTVGGDKFADGEGASYNVTGSQTEAGSSYNTFTYTLNEGTNEDNYNITKTEGKLTVSPSASEIIVTITGHTGSKTYDGAEMTVTGYDVSISNPAYTEGDFSFNGNGTLSKTDAGTYSMGLKASDFANTNGNYSNVIFNVTDGSLVIARRKVTLTSATDQKTYDGTALTNDFVAVSGDGFVDGEGATYKVTGSQTNADYSKNTFTYTLNDGTKADNYEIDKVEGTLTVDPREITITADEASKYVGEADPEDYISTPGVVTRIMRWIRPAAAFGATVTSGEVVVGDKLAFKVTRPRAGKDEARGTYKDAVEVTETDTAANANYKITWIPADFHIYEDGLKVEKTVKAPTAPKTVFELGDVMEFNIKVTNTGNTDLKDVIVKDELDGATIGANTGYTVNTDGTATIAELIAGASVNVKATYTVKAADLGNTSFTNKATATAKTENPKKPEGKVTGEDETDPIAIDSRRPAMEITKTVTNLPAGGEGFVEGDTVRFEIKVKNTGNLALSKVTVTDELADTTIEAGTGYVVDNNKAVIADLPLNAEITITASHVVTKADVANKNFKNTVTVTSKVPDPTDPGKETEGPENPAETDTIPTKGVQVQKTVTSKAAAADGKYVAGEKVTFDITVTNTGNTVLGNFRVVDQLENTIILEGAGYDVTTDTATGLAAAVVNGLAENTSITIKAEHIVTEADLRKEHFKNVAVAELTDPQNPDNPKKEEGETPDIPKVDADANWKVTKTVTNLPSRGYFRSGETAEFDIKVENTGNQTLNDIVVADLLSGAELKAGSGYTLNADGTATIATLKVGETVVLKAAYTVTSADVTNKKFVNAATASIGTETETGTTGDIPTRTTGGGNSGGGGGGGSSSGPRDNGGSSSGGPGTTTVTIDPDAVPLANLPNEDGADNLLMIDDEDVPLAALPKTGQSGTNGLVFFLSSMMLAAFVAVTKKREDDK